MMYETVSNWALHAFVDGELDGQEKHDIENLLLRDEAARRFVARLVQQKQALHSAFDGTLQEPVPARLLAAAQQRPAQNRASYFIAASMAGFLVLGGALGYFAADHMAKYQAFDLPQIAYLAHQTFAGEVKHPVEVAASEQTHLQNWLSKRVGQPIKIPDLTAQGYSLLGGRLLAESEGPAGQLMYETADKQRLTVFLTENLGGVESALRLEQHGNLITCYWRNGKLAMAVTADLPRADMMNLAKNIYDMMEANS